MNQLKSGSIKQSNKELLLTALFLLFFSWLVWTSYWNVPKFTINNTALPLLCAFKDDINLVSSTISGAETLLCRCITAVAWAELECRSVNTTHFSVWKAPNQPQVSSSIPSIHFRPIKFMGHMIDGSISDRNFSAELTDTILALTSVIDKKFEFYSTCSFKGSHGLS